VGVRLNICSKLVKNKTFFFRIIHCFCLIPELSQNKFVAPRPCKPAGPTGIFLTRNLCFGLPYHLTKLGHEVFSAPRTS
jgi:hypothetical protein